MTEFYSWLHDTQERRDLITEFSKVAMVNVDKAIDYSAEWEIMENTAESYIAVEKAKQIKESKAKYPGYSLDERKTFVRSDMDQMHLFVANLKVIGQVLRDRIYCRHDSRSR